MRGLGIFAIPAVVSILAMGGPSCGGAPKEDRILLETQAAPCASPGDPASPAGAAPASPAAPAAGAPAGEIPPPLPPSKLPPLSAKPPDPAVEQHRRGKVFLEIAEKVQPMARPSYSFPSADRVLQKYLAEYFRRAGFEVAHRCEDGDHRVEGDLEAKFVEVIEFQGQDIAHKYAGSLRLAVLAKGAAQELERVDVPEFFKDGIQRPGEPEDRIAVLEMRRHLAKVAWERLFLEGKVFADPEIPALLASLAADDSEKEAPIQAEAVLKALVAKRLAAVPYLLEALTDERIVRVNARYPGLTAENAQQLRVYHLADKALEEIFQKVSRMDLETPTKARFAMIRGWEGEWARFCPSFRDSPGRKAGKKA